MYYLAAGMGLDYCTCISLSGKWSVVVLPQVLVKHSSYRNGCRMLQGSRVTHTEYICLGNRKQISKP